MKTYPLTSGDYTLCFPQNGDGGFALAVFHGGKEVCFTGKPCYAFIKQITTTPDTYAAAYTAVEETDGAILASGEITTLGGMVLAFRDEYTSSEAGSFALKRTVSVVKTTEAEEYGFASRIHIHPVRNASLAEVNCFGPGAWYQKNEYVPKYFLGDNKQQPYHWLYETQYALPMFAVQDPESGEAACISRRAADVKLRDVNKKLMSYMVDESITFGSIGASTGDGLSLDYVYPGARATGYPRSIAIPVEPHFANEYHPLREGFADVYETVIDFTCEKDYAALIRYFWRRVYTRIGEPIVELDNEKLYRSCMNLLRVMTHHHRDGSWGLPFSATLPDAYIMDTSFEMGFVGQQPGIGYQLIRYGTLHNDADALEKGLGIISFWVENSLSEFGAPRCWYNPDPGFGWEDRPYWIRMIGDGMEDILDSYVFLKKQGVEKPGWLQYCETAAGWLIEVQNDDGSWQRNYDREGKKLQESKANTSNVIRFLVQLYVVTGKEIYKETALAAGTWCLDNITRYLEYRGGTCDNSDVYDKESGIYALFAYLSLYDLTKEKIWLDAAKAAADYVETWTYAWSYPVHFVYPSCPLTVRNISGQSLIATGHSAADMYMAACPYVFYRLYLHTRDEHYLHFARFIHKNAKQSTDYDGSFGYKYAGLCYESGPLYTQVYDALHHWLPWCTYVQVDPISRFVDTFGVYEIDDAQKLDPEFLKKANDIYAVYGK